MCGLAGFLNVARALPGETLEDIASTDGRHLAASRAR